MDLYFLLFLLHHILRMVNGDDEVSSLFDANRRLNNLSGKELNVVMIPLSTFIQVFRNSSGHVIGFGGILYEQMAWLSRRFNFTMHIEPSKDNVYGVPDANGDYSGLYGQLQRAEIDLGLVPFIMRHRVIELCVYILGDSFGMLVKYPVPKTKTDAPIQVFSLYVWIGLLLSIIACIGFIQLFIFITRKYSRSIDGENNQLSHSTLSNTSYFIFGTLTNHSVPSGNGPRSAGIITVFWILATFVFVNVYSSCIMSYMSLRFQRPDINTFTDLANSPNYFPTAFKGIVPETIFMESTPGTMMRKIGDKLLECNDRCRLLDYDGMLKNVLEGDFVALLVTLSGNYYIKKTMTDDRQCRLTMAKETVGHRHMYLGVPRSSPYDRELNRESIWYNSFGLLNYWIQKMMPVPSQCILQYNNQGEFVQLVDLAILKLGQFYVAFVGLFVGYVLALLQFLRERFVTRC